MTSGVSGALQYLRQLVNDPDGETFTPSELQRSLDDRAIDLELLHLHPLRKFVPGGTVEFFTFTSPRRDLMWFSDETVVVDNAYNLLTPEFTDLDVGRWTFTTSRPDATVFAIGRSYDPYGSASDLMAEVAGSFSDNPSSFSVLNGSFTYQESQRKGPLELSRMYANKARQYHTDIVRRDVNAF